MKKLIYRNDLDGNPSMFFIETTVNLSNPDLSYELNIRPITYDESKITLLYDEIEMLKRKIINKYC